MKKLLIVLFCLGLIGCGVTRKINYYRNLKDAVVNATNLNGLNQQLIYERFGSPDYVTATHSRFVGKMETWTYKHHNGELIISFSDGIVTNTFYH